MNKKIENLTVENEPMGNGEVTVARWTYGGKPRHTSTLKNSTTIEQFRRSTIKKFEDLESHGGLSALSNYVR